MNFGLGAPRASLIGTSSLNTIEGALNGTNLRIGIVASRFNAFITGKLLEGAVDCACRHGIEDERLELAWVPGAFEIPLVAKTMASSGKYDAVVCLGAVIRGATAHFELVAGQAASGLAQASLDTNRPVIFGLLTTDTIEQAIERAGTKAGNKGWEAMLTAIEMSNLLLALNGEH